MSTEMNERANSMRLHSLPRESIKAGVHGAIAMLILAGLIVLGSRNLSHFDAALVGYTFASLFSLFGIVYRYSMWLQRPPTAMYWRRGWQAFFQRNRNAGSLGWGQLLGLSVQRVFSDFAANLFIWRRSWLRALAHRLIMWGCLIAAAITFPLVFGWVHFDFTDGSFEAYRVNVFGFPTASFGVESFLAFLIFHGLVWASFLVMAGVMLAMRRRMRSRDAFAIQRFGEDFLPLIMLFAVSVTGLMLVVSYQWMHGFAYEFLSITHAATVIFTLLWMPFGKFFHVFQRPAQLGVSFYKDAGARGEQAACGRCRKPYASKMQIDDLIQVERQLGYQYEMSHVDVDHYQRICPRCRRIAVALTQGKLWKDAHG